MAVGCRLDDDSLMVKLPRGGPCQFVQQPAARQEQPNLLANFEQRLVNQSRDPAQKAGDGIVSELSLGSQQPAFDLLSPVFRSNAFIGMIPNAGSSGLTPPGSVNALDWRM